MFPNLSNVCQMLLGESFLAFHPTTDLWQEALKIEGRMFIIYCTQMS